MCLNISFFFIIGALSTEISVIYGPFLIHTVTVFLVDNSTLSNGIAIENTVDFENPPKNRETELFMRVISDVQNGEPPEFYSDLNGFNMQKRLKIERIGKCKLNNFFFIIYTISSWQVVDKLSCLYFLNNFLFFLCDHSVFCPLCLFSSKVFNFNYTFLLLICIFPVPSSIIVFFFTF